MQIGQIPLGTVLASGLALLAAVIVYATFSGAPLPFLDSDRAAFIALAVVGFGMCIASGVGTDPAAPRAAVPTVVASIAGVLALFTIVAVVAGWTVVFDPLAQVIYGAPAAGVMDRVGIIALAVLIAIGWVVATMRQLGAVLSPAGA